MSIPVYINVRDRLTVLRELVDWLERAGHERIILLDNDSTYEPLLDYYRATPHTVRKLGKNVGARSLWHLDEVPDEPFVFTDPDVVPHEKCPLNAVEYFAELLGRHHVPKVGFSLFLNDVPAYMPSLGHERRLMLPQDRVEPGAIRSALDTTFALYRPRTQVPNFQWLALRTEWPYTARHKCPSWYVDRAPTEDEVYYFERADKSNNGSSGARRVAFG